MNSGSSLGSTLFFEFQVNDSVASWEVVLPAFTPQDLIAIPSGSTHYKISAAGVGLDFDSGSRSLVNAVSPVLSVLDPALSQTLTVDKGQLSGIHFAFVLSVEIIQVVNGIEYAINNGAHNAAKVISVAKTA